MTTSLSMMVLAAATAAGEPAGVDSVSAALASRIADAPLVRIHTARGTPRLGHALASVEGVRFTPAFGGLEARRGPGLVTWSDIQAVEVGRTRMGTGAAVGLLAGVAAAVAWNLSDPPESDAGFLRFGPTASAKAVGRTLLLAAGGAAIGAGVGYQMRTWERVYP